MLEDSMIQRLVTVAREALDHAHAPLSGFPVGAAVLTSKGNIFAGCNTESIIPSLGVCAERSAVNHAVVHGEKEFDAVVIVSKKMEPLVPCGACRQYLYEYAQIAGRDVDVVSFGENGKIFKTTLSELYPNGFGPKDKHF